MSKKAAGAWAAGAWGGKGGSALPPGGLKKLEYIIIIQHE